MRIRPAALFLAAALGCSAHPAGPAGDSLNVLFIGNSLTYSNELPKTLVAIAASAGRAIRVESVALANVALIDHVNGGSGALSAIRRGGWHFVVLQQGPTSTGPSPDRDTLILATQLLDSEIRKIGGRTALFMVWPPRARLPFFDNVRDAYRAAADAVNGVFLPAGEAWRTAWQADPDLELYSADSFHPSPLGSFLAALVIYEALTDTDVRELAPKAYVGDRELTVSQPMVRSLQAAAHETALQFRR